LYIAGLLKKSGLEPICAEPDIIIDQEGSHFGIAVKRVNSFRRLDKNLRKARDQIVKTTRPGIILVDITRISNPENLITLSDSITKVTNDLIRHLDLFFEKNYSAMNNIIDNSQVFGIMLHMSCLCIVNGRLGYSSRITLRNLCSEESQYMNDFSFFAQSLKRSYC